ncbi:MAG: low specificity L-threonine aldolase [Opitutae bacterium]|nr:low specificity L-threonine aldolase [Opitutae bacterium]
MSARPDIPHDYSFASDNTAGLAPEALAALTAANPGRAPSYGADEWTARAKQLIRDVFATDCEVFFVFNGTAANALALAHVCPSYQAILCHDYAHADTDECGAPEFFSGGSKVITVAGPLGKLLPADIERTIARRANMHYSKAGALTLTQITEWGTIYTPDEVRALSAVARAHGLVLHMDGARFANAAAALAARGQSPADGTWRAGVDVLSFGGTKNGMNTTEAVVFFNRALARDFDFRVKQAAQLASKQRFATAQWVGMLEGGAWLKHATHANTLARKLADMLRGLPQVKFIAEPEASGVFVELPRATAEAMWARGWHFYRFIGDDGYRLMCSWATQPADVERFVADLQATLRAG